MFNLTPDTTTTTTTTTNNNNNSNNINMKETKEKDLEIQSKDSKSNKTNKQIIPFETEALRLKQKCKDLKQKIADIEAQNQVRTIGVSRAKDSISRLRFEYSLLLEFLEKKSDYLAYPNLNNFKPSDINADSIESLTLEDLTKLLNKTPLSLSNIKNLLPNALGDLISERQQEFINNSSISNQSNSTNGKTRRKRGVSNGSTTSSRKRIRDPREPKRPTNAYLFFCDSERDRVKAEWAKEHPTEHIDLSRAMTDVWRKMSNDDKKPYFEMYEKDKERYHKAVEEFANIKEQERLAAVQSSNPASVEPELEAEIEPEVEIETPISITTAGENTPIENDIEDEELVDAEDEDHDTSIQGIDDITNNEDLEVEKEDDEDDDEEEGEEEERGEGEEDEEEEDDGEEEEEDEDGNSDHRKIPIKKENIKLESISDNDDVSNLEIPEEEEEEIEEEDEDNEDEKEEVDNNNNHNIKQIENTDIEEDDTQHSADFTDGLQDDDSKSETPLLKSELETSFNEGSEL